MNLFQNNPFELMSFNSLITYQSIYKKLIEEHDSKYVKVINNKIVPASNYKMPWMLPIYNIALEKVNHILKTKYQH
jgi:hypothetical protein